jgi:hypothetical protein
MFLSPFVAASPYPLGRVKVKDLSQQPTTTQSHFCLPCTPRPFHQSSERAPSFSATCGPSELPSADVHILYMALAPTYVLSTLSTLGGSICKVAQSMSVARTPLQSVRANLNCISDQHSQVSREWQQKTARCHMAFALVRLAVSAGMHSCHSILRHPPLLGAKWRGVSGRT